MYNNIGVYDWQTVLRLVEVIAWAAVVGAALVFFTRSKTFNKQNRQIMLLLFAAWAVASIGVASLTTYDYFRDNGQRKILEQSIDVYTGVGH